MGKYSVYEEILKLEKVSYEAILDICHKNMKKSSKNSRKTKKHSKNKKLCEK